MRIIYLLSHAPQSGPVNQALNLLTCLNKMSHEVHLVTLYEEQDNSWLYRFVNAGITVYQVHERRSNIWGTIRKVNRYIQENRIDIVHSSGFMSDTINHFLTNKVRKINTIRQNFNDIAEDSNYILRKFAQFFTRLNYHSFNRCVACSKDLGNSLMRDLRLKCNVVQNGVDTDLYKPINQSSKQELRNKFNLPTDKFLFLCVGVFYPRKQMVELVNAFKAANLANSMLLLVGDGETYAATKRAAKGLKNVVLTGKVDNPLSYYQLSDCFVSASLAEGLPNSVMEAMACGLPCILSNIGPHVEIAAYDEDVAILYQSSDYEQLSGALGKMMNKNIRGMGDKAAVVISNHLSKYNTARNYVNIYQCLMNNDKDIINSNCL